MLPFNNYPLHFFHKNDTLLMMFSMKASTGLQVLLQFLAMKKDTKIILQQSVFPIDFKRHV